MHATLTKVESANLKPQLEMIQQSLRISADAFGAEAQVDLFYCELACRWRTKEKANTCSWTEISEQIESKIIEQQVECARALDSIDKV